MDLALVPAALQVALRGICCMRELSLWRQDILQCFGSGRAGETFSLGSAQWRSSTLGKEVFCMVWGLWERGLEFFFSENQRHCKDFRKTGHLAPNSQGAVMEWRWCSVAVHSLEIFPFHYADIRDWQELILMGAMCEIHSKLLLLFGCFRSANHMLCSSAQPWCGLSLAWLFCLALEVP